MRTFPLLAIVALSACAAAAEPPAARPAAAGTGPSVAVVIASQGSAAVLPATGQAFAPAPGTPLLRTDVVTAPPRGFVLLALGNGWLVRVDEEIALAVADIALL